MCFLVVFVVLICSFLLLVYSLVVWREPEPGVSWGHSSAQWPSLPERGRVRSQVAGAEALMVRSEPGSFPCVLSLLPEPAPWPQRGAVLEQEGLVWVLGGGLVTGCVGPAAVSHPECF